MCEILAAKYPFYNKYLDNCLTAEQYRRVDEAEALPTATNDDPDIPF
jgi:hypothetical protein